jgi:hypothetical protein
MTAPLPTSSPSSLWNSRLLPNHPLNNLFNLFRAKVGGQRARLPSYKLGQSSPFRSSFYFNNQAFHLVPVYTLFKLPILQRIPPPLQNPLTFTYFITNSKIIIFTRHQHSKFSGSLRFHVHFAPVIRLDLFGSTTPCALPFVLKSADGLPYPSATTQ